MKLATVAIDSAAASVRAEMGRPKYNKFLFDFAIEYNMQMRNW